MDLSTFGWAFGIIFVAIIISVRLYRKELPEFKEPPKSKESQSSKKIDPKSYKLRPFAQELKTILQMFIGIALVLLIILKFAHHLGYFADQTPQNTKDFLSKYVYNLPTLDIVGLALAYSAGVELAYALFTPGPDEAIEPLITGLAAGILLLISSPTKFDFSNASGIALLVLALIALFALKYIFLDSEGLTKLLRGSDSDQQPPLEQTSSNNVQQQKSTDGTNDISTSSHPSEQ